MTRFGRLLGAVLVLLGVFWTGRESSHGLTALWEHWWCPLPLVLIVLGVGSVITSHRAGLQPRSQLALIGGVIPELRVWPEGRHSLQAVQPEDWDWSRTVVDHLDLHASDFPQSVRFYDTVLAPLGIPKLFERDGEACFTHVNVVARTPPTNGLHLCFYTRSKAEVDAFHRAGVEAGFRSNGAPGYRDYAPGYYAAYLLDPDENNIEALYRDVGNPGHAAQLPRLAITFAAEVAERALGGHS